MAISADTRKCFRMLPAADLYFLAPTRRTLFHLSLNWTGALLAAIGCLQRQVHLDALTEQQAVSDCETLEIAFEAEIQCLKSDANSRHKMYEAGCLQSRIVLLLLHAWLRISRGYVKRALPVSRAGIRQQACQVTNHVVGYSIS